MPAIITKAPGKTILFGEHAVVYGYPAIAVPLQTISVKTTILPNINGNYSIVKIRNLDRQEDLRLSHLDSSNPISACVEILKKHLDTKIPNFEMTISSTIPIAAGLGSSAALAVSIFRGLSQFLGFQLSNDEINSLAFQSEVIQHGSPSGIDNNVITYGKPILFEKGKSISPIPIQKPIQLILADSGERTLTRTVIEAVRDRRKENPEIINSIFAEIGEITQSALPALKSGDIKLIGELMNKNHSALAKLQVSTDKLDKLVKAAIAGGAIGAKLCGGGMGGFIVAVCNPAKVKSIEDHLLSAEADNIIPSQVCAISKEMT